MRPPPDRADAGIIVGPWTFADNAFTNDAAQLDAGLAKSVDEQFLDDAGLDEVLTGFSPTKGLANIGSAGFANLFQLDFTDLFLINGSGTDLVFFDARFSPDRYEIAVRPFGSDFTAFRTFETDDFIDTGLAGPTQPPGDAPFRLSTLFGLPIELDDFGLVGGTLVDAIQFRALPLDPSSPDSSPQGDPVMAGALNVVPAVPEPTSLTLLGIGVVSLFGFRWRRKRMLAA